MSRSDSQVFEEKMALVYENNHASSLFIRAANRELKKNNPHKALEILDQGIKNFPKYPTAYILLGKVQLELKNFDRAEEAFRKGCDLANSSGSLSYYLSELENKKSKYPNYAQSRRISFFESSNAKETQISNESAGDSSEEKNTKESNFRSNNPAENEPLENNSGGLSIDDRLEDVAKEISAARISVSNNPEQVNPPADNKKEDSRKTEHAPIISETLAKIYISQGKFKEAIEVYKKLQVKSPDKKGFYQMKIDEIQKQLGDLDRL